MWHHRLQPHRPVVKTALTIAILAVLALVFMNPVVRFVIKMSRAAEYVITGKASVIDGDTIEIGPHRIRFWGIDAAEPHTDKGKKAKAFLESIIQHRTVVCRDRGQQSYGRMVAQCFIRGRDIAGVLISAGHARDNPQFSGGHYAP